MILNWKMFPQRDIFGFQEKILRGQQKSHMNIITVKLMYCTPLSKNCMQIKVLHLGVFM